MNLGFIGAGKITSSVVTGICRSKIKFKKIILSPRNRKISKKLKKKFRKVYIAKNNQEVVNSSNWIFLAVTPTVGEKIIKNLKFKSSQTIISFISTMTLPKLKKAIKAKAKIFRAIPLPPISLRKGPVPVFPPNKKVKNFFNKLGTTVEIRNEKLSKNFWSTSGMMAPFYELLNTMSNWLIKRGVKRDKAQKYITSLFVALSEDAVVNSKKDLKLLEQSSQFGLSGDKALEFIYKLDEARSFFKPFLMQNKKKARKAFYFLRPVFRVNKEDEEGANQIIDWQLETPLGKVKNGDNKPKTIVWRLGDPVKFQFRWAKDAPFLPITVRSPWGKLKDRTITYSFENLWSLATVLNEFMANEEDFKTSGIRTSNLLIFESKTREWSEEKAKKALYLPKSGKARFFVQLQVINPATKDSIVFPDLPELAPQLMKELNS